MKTPTFLALLLFLAAAKAEIVINEIHYDAPEPNLNEEFIELHNTSTEAVDLSNWRFSGGVAFTFPAGIILEGGGYLVVALDPNLSLFDGVDKAGPWEGRLDGDGERIVLRDATGQPIDEVDYEVRFPWPIASGGDGPSMELLNPTADNDLGSSWRPAETVPTPGKANSVFVDNTPPNIRQVNWTPKAPNSSEEVTITVKLTDTEGMQNVVLHYLISEPGDYTPAYQPHSRSALLADPDAARRKHAGYAEGLFTGRWPTIGMAALDAGNADEDPDNDDLYAVTLPAQINRSLVRFYITAEDGAGTEVRGPLEDDPSLNFAYFVYDGVPDYVAAEDSVNGPGHIYDSELLQQLPVYHLITRTEDWFECLAYSGGDQHPRSAMSARRAYNWSGTIVYGDEVYDNIAYRLRGGNGRYHERGKRSMKFRFNRGRHFELEDNHGRPYERKWRVLTTSKMFGNRLGGTQGTRRGHGNFGLVDTVNGQLWELFGVPAVRTHWFHFRVIDDVEEAPDQYGGDFYGLNLALERIDVRFLESRDLPKGNLYKLTDQSENISGVGGKGSNSDGKIQQRYQAPNAPLDAEDYVNIFRNLRPARDDEWLHQHVNWDIWNRYTAVEEAIRHYDYWPDADKNMVQYFEPQPGNEFGLYWQLPYDSDASWGPSWNSGVDYAQNVVDRRDDLERDLKNTIREFRDLVWQPEVIDHLIGDAALIIEDFYPADRDRWANAPTASGRQDHGTLESKVADMKLFAFEGNLSYPGGNVGPGGRAAHLDGMMEDAGIPKTPTIGFAEGASAAIDGVSFEASEYKAANIFTPSQLAQVEWRLAEVTDPNAPAYDPEEIRHYEITSIWSEIVPGDAANLTSIDVPASLLKVGRAYRGRVRHRDIENRVSHWSEPIAFIAESPNAGAALQDSLVLTEIMYHPAEPSEEEMAAGYDESDYEFLELHNRSPSPITLTNVRFTKGVDFDFPEGATLEAGRYGVLAANEAAIKQRYGNDVPVVGEWESNFSLSNGGERLKLSFGAGNAIFDFQYEDEAPWPLEADGHGPSLVLRKPEEAAASGYGEAANWRAGSVAGGTPGRAEDGDGGPDPEPNGLATWLAENGFSDADADPDGDGITAAMVYALGLDWLGEGVSPSRGLPTVMRGDSGIQLHVRLRSNDVADVTIEMSDDLTTWNPSTATRGTMTANDDGSVNVPFIIAAPLVSEGYWRVRLRFASD